MKTAIMQPYFLPYIGYWQLLNTVDKFIIYDNIQYTKKGWINRNRYLIQNEPAYFTVPLVGAEEYLDIDKREVSETFWKGKILNQLDAAYKKSPYYKEVRSILDYTFSNKKDNLFDFLKCNIQNMMDVLDISTELIVSSDLSTDRSKKGEDRVIDLCERVGTTTYINPIGGLELYDSNHFSERNIELRFIKSRLTPYKQFNNDFIPALSIVDVIAFNGIDGTKQMLSDFDLIQQ